jgi:general secretion pathway protein D
MLFRCSRIAGIALVATLSGVIVGCASQTAYTHGMELIAQGDQEEGLAELEKAVRLEPTNARYRIDYRNQVARLMSVQVAAAEEALREGDLATARERFLAALKYDPSNESVRRAIAALDQEQRFRALVADAERQADAGQLEAARDRLRAALADNPASQTISRALLQMQARVDKAEEARQARLAATSVMKHPVTLQFRDANVRMVFEALSRTTGLNVILDRDVRADLKTTIFVRDATVEDTVNLILLQNQLDKKVLNSNTMFIYPATAAKQKEYQDLKVRTFQISNGDAKHLQNVLKSVLKMKDVALDERSNTLVIRDTPDAVAVAEKVVLAHDLPDAEVMLEVQVIEVSRERLLNLGISWPTSFTLSTPDSASTLGGLRALTSSQLNVTPLAVGFNFQLQDTDANLLASPRIRARDREKARILIGDKVPVITNTVTPVSTGSSVVTGSVQYLDVGIKLEVEPRVYLEGDVGIKLNLEVSNIVKQIGDGSANSTLAYQIGTRNASTTLRLRDGETQVLGGLIGDQERNAADKVPGLGQLPVLGRLFRSDSGTSTKTEIVLSITPHIVRGAGVAESRYRDVFSGSETTMRDGPLRLDPIGSVGVSTTTAPQAPATNQPAPRATPPAPSPSAPAPRPEDQGANDPRPSSGDSTPAAAEPAAGQPAPPATPAPEGTPPAPAAEPQPAAPQPLGAASPPAGAVVATAAAGAGSAATKPPAATPATASGTAPPFVLTWQGPFRVKVGEEFNVVLRMNSPADLRTVPLEIHFDPQVLSFIEAKPGDFLQTNGATVAVTSVDGANGLIQLELRAGETKSLRGQGDLVTLRFSSLAAWKQAQLTIAKQDLKDASGSVAATIRSTPLTLRVTGS